MHDAGPSTAILSVRSVCGLAVRLGTPAGTVIGVALLAAGTLSTTLFIYLGELQTSFVLKLYKVHYVCKKVS